MIRRKRLNVSALRRGSKAVVAQGATSATSMVLFVAVARAGDLALLGRYSIYYAAFLVAVQVVREATITPLLSRKLSDPELKSHADRQSLAGLVLGPVTVLIGAMLVLPDLIWLGFGLHGMLLLHYIKLVSVTFGNGQSAILQELVVLTAVCIAGLGAVFFDLPAQAPFLVWICMSAVVGYISALTGRYAIRPRWRAEQGEGAASASFSLQALVNASSVHVLTMAVGLTAGLPTVGALRGASTLVGPANLVLTAVQPILIRRVSAYAERPSHIRARLLLRDAALTMGAYSAAVIPLLALGYLAGEVLLGEDVWPSVRPILILVAADGLLAGVATVAVSYHRATWNHRRALAISLTILIPRWALVLSLASVFGAPGAAAGALIATSIASLLWWVSAVRLKALAGESGS